VVKLCTSKSEPFEKYAVKIMRVPDQEFYDIALKEYNLLDDITSHKNIINVYDMFYNRAREKIYMLMEYCGEGSDLTGFIKKWRENE